LQPLLSGSRAVAPPAPFLAAPIALALACTRGRAGGPAEGRALRPARPAPQAPLEETPAARQAARCTPGPRAPLPIPRECLPSTASPSAATCPPLRRTCPPARPLAHSCAAGPAAARAWPRFPSHNATRQAGRQSSNLLVITTPTHFLAPLCNCRAFKRFVPGPAGAVGAGAGGLSGEEARSWAWVVAGVPTWSDGGAALLRGGPAAGDKQQRRITEDWQSPPACVAAMLRRCSLITPAAAWPALSRRVRGLPP
jgi:hypothetical protein